MMYLLQVLGGTVIQFLFGALWYGPLNGELFFQLAYGAAKPPANLNFTLCISVAAVAAFGLNNVLKLLLDTLDVYTLTAGCCMGALVWAFGLFLALPHVFYESRSLVLMLVHEIGHLLVLLLLGMYYALMAASEKK